MRKKERFAAIVAIIVAGSDTMKIETVLRFRKTMTVHAA